jgi:hypothetical protein
VGPEKKKSDIIERETKSKKIELRGYCIFCFYIERKVLRDAEHEKTFQIDLPG